VRQLPDRDYITPRNREWLPWAELGSYIITRGIEGRASARGVVWSLYEEDIGVIWVTDPAGIAYYTPEALVEGLGVTPEMELVACPICGLFTVNRKILSSHCLTCGHRRPREMVINWNSE